MGTAKEGVLARVWALLARAAKVYGVFAVLHLLYKYLSYKMKLAKAEKFLKHLPGDKVDFTQTSLTKNLSRLHDWRRDLLLKNPGAPLVRTDSPSVEVVCNTADSVEEILKRSFDKSTKPGPENDYAFGLLGQFLGDEGIFVLPHGAQPEMKAFDKAWYDQRKTSSKLFTKNNFEGLVYSTLVKKTDIFVDTIAKIADENAGISTNDASKGATKVNMQDKFFSFTFDVISKVFFNRSVDSLSGNTDPYAQAFDFAHREMILHLFKTMPVNVMSRYFLPFPFGSLTLAHNSINPGFEFFRNFIDPHYPKFKEHIETLDNFTYDVVRQARKDSENLTDRRDMISFFLKNSVNPPSDKQLHDIILNFIIAGRDTTACALTWLFFELATNQDVQEKLSAEIFAKFGKDGVPKLEELSRENLPYLHACMLEGLRMHPPVPEDAKMATEDILFPCGTTLPKGTKMLFCPRAMGRDPVRFPQPEKFRPERWLEEPDPVKSPLQKSMFELPIFQAGPRYCIGMNLAKNEIKLVTTRMIQHFTFDLEASEKVEDISYALMITMSLVNSKDKHSHQLNLVPKRRVH